MQGSGWDLAGCLGAGAEVAARIEGRLKDARAEMENRVGGRSLAGLLLLPRGQQRRLIPTQAGVARLGRVRGSGRGEGGGV